MASLPPSRLHTLLVALGAVLLAMLVWSAVTAASEHGRPALHLGTFAGGLLALACSGVALWLKARDRRRTAELEATNEALLREVAERRRAEEVLRQSEARLRTLVHNFPNGAVFLFDHDLRYLVADGRDLAKVGLSPEVMEGKRIDEVLDPEVCALYEPVYRATLEGRAPPEVELGYAGRLYRIYPVAVRDDGGSVMAGMVIAIDITEVRRDEHERRRMEQKLQEKQRLESLGVLAGGIAHDFNNLLAAILGNAEVLRLDLPASSPSQENVDAVITVTRRASELVQQLLAYAGKRRVVLRPLSLDGVIRELGELLRASIEKHGRVVYDLVEPLPAVTGDASQLRQIVMNLLVNASEALAPTTGGTITVTTAAVTLGASDLARIAPGAELAPGPYVRLTVADTGCGMDAATLARIFDPFFTTKRIGRGLGLAAVHGIVRSHGGALAVTSAPGRGTTFDVWLPATEAPPEPLCRPRPSELPPRRGTVLVIDDEEVVRETLSNALERLGYDVRAELSGPEGLSALRAGIPDLSVILVDLSMPDLPGDAAVRALRAHRPDVPIMLMSGYREEDVLEQVGDLGQAAFLQKPFSLDELKAALRAALERG